MMPTQPVMEWVSIARLDSLLRLLVLLVLLESVSLLETCLARLRAYIAVNETAGRDAASAMKSLLSIRRNCSLKIRT